MYYYKYCFVIVIIFFTETIFASSNKANALLKGAGTEILKYDCFRVCYTETRGEEGKTVSQVVDFDHGKIRKEHLKNENFSGWIDIVNDNECFRFKFQEHEHVKLTSSDSELARHSGIYDPRILFLGDIPFYTSTVEKRLPCDRHMDAVVENTVLDEIPVKRIICQNGEDTWEYFITEPGFRVLKIVFSSLSSPSICFTTTNKYKNSNLGPFPSEIKIHREESGKVKFDRTIHVTSFEVKKSFSLDTFTYKSMNLPLNTAVVDYRLQRRLGYWDGEKLAENPVKMSVQEQREWDTKQGHQPLGNVVRYMMIGGGILLIVISIIFKIRKRLIGNIETK